MVNKPYVSMPKSNEIWKNNNETIERSINSETQLLISIVQKLVI